MSAKLRMAIVLALSAVVALALPTHAAKLKTIHQFCTIVGCQDGVLPIGGLVSDASGRLYGVTAHGGATQAGTAFELTPNGHRTRWSFRLIHSFCVPDCLSAAQPEGALIIDTAGNLYGLSDGGANNAG